MGERAEEEQRKGDGKPEDPVLGGMLLQGLERKDLLDLILVIDDQLEAAKKRIVFVPWREAGLIILEIFLQ